jgi:hypothetical protein
MGTIQQCGIVMNVDEVVDVVDYLWTAPEHLRSEQRLAHTEG